MKKFPALLIALILTISLFVTYTYFGANPLGERENVIVARVIDGDTFVTNDQRTIRMLNINTPEKKEPFSDLAPAYLSQFINQSLEVEITGTEKYGRLLARVYAKDYLNLYFVEQGFATSFLVDESESDLFKKAQENAYEKGQGVWRRSPSFGCMQIEINKKEEFLEITHSCGSLSKWILKDESTRTYKFSGSEPQSFVLHSGKGQESQNEFYWRYDHVWNDDKDSIFVRDDTGLLVYYDQYGY